MPENPNCSSCSSHFRDSVGRMPADYREPMMMEPESMLPLAKVRFGLPGALTHFDPALPGETSEGSTIKLISGQLLRFDQYGVPQPDLAESMHVSDDGLVYTFTLRENLMYSDGTPVTVGDIVFTWERIKDAPPTDQGPIANVVSVEATDDRTVVWTLSLPEPTLPYWFGRTGFSVHPQAQVEADPDGYFRNPVSAGPYYVASGEPGDPVVTLKENPNYQLGPLSVQGARAALGARSDLALTAAGHRPTGLCLRVAAAGARHLPARG